MPLADAAVANAVALATTSLTAALEVPVKEAGTRRRRHRDKREAAYVALQHAVVDVLLSADQVSSIRPSVSGIVWVFGPFQRSLREFSAATHDLHKAWMDVRTYGNPKPRIEAERLVEAVRQLMTTLPVGKPGERQRRQWPYLERQRVVGQAQHDFTVAVRIDLGLDRPVRKRRWQLRRRRAVDWPGGWPVNVTLPDPPSSSDSTS